MKMINGWAVNIKPELQAAIDREYATKDITPPRQVLFKALELTAVEEVKVVIYGQDPYPTKGVATGLAFSSNQGLPASLRNMFKELETDLGVTRTNPNLEDWAKQGVLLLNSALTCEVGNAGSHSKLGWKDVIGDLTEQINQLDRPVIFVLLGGHAKQYKKIIDPKHIVLEFTHPSPLSAYRGFFGSKMYSQINLKLEANGYSPIEFGDAQTTLF